MKELDATLHDHSVILDVEIGEDAIIPNKRPVRNRQVAICVVQNQICVVVKSNRSKENTSGIMTHNDWTPVVGLPLLVLMMVRVNLDERVSVPHEAQVV
jgi:hypothetical protein